MKRNEHHLEPLELATAICLTADPYDKSAPVCRCSKGNLAFDDPHRCQSCVAISTQLLSRYDVLRKGSIDWLELTERELVVKAIFVGFIVTIVAEILYGLDWRFLVIIALITLLHLASDFTVVRRRNRRANQRNRIIDGRYQ